MRTLKQIRITAIIDFVMILALAASFISTDIENEQRNSFRNDIDNSFSWGTVHSLTSILFSVIIIIHIWQHWPLIKSIIKKKLYLNNIVITLTTIAFFLTVVSFLLYITGFNHFKGEFHGVIARIFLIMACLHLILNFKKMLKLFAGFKEIPATDHHEVKRGMKV